ncbi:MAG: 2-C-methyl-D-erythritol 4-phosphate cytidylyltransferase [Chitinivibrionales bacterium]
MAEEFDVVVAAAGEGSRLGYSQPKAFVPLAGKPLLSYSISVFEHHPNVGVIIVVVSEQMMEQADEVLSSLDIQKPVHLVPGGQHRWQSVRNGVEKSLAQWIMVHDAARPFVTKEVIDGVLAKREAFRCCITATPVVDTIRRYEDEQCLETIDRSELLRVGTPQLFNRDSLMGAFRQISTFKSLPTDEAMLMEQSGIPVGFAWGDSLNFKITTPQDLAVAEALLATGKK